MLKILKLKLYKQISNCIIGYEHFNDNINQVEFFMMTLKLVHSTMYTFYILVILFLKTFVLVNVTFGWMHDSYA
jgi:hypothetical protein